MLKNVTDSPTGSGRQRTRRQRLYGLYTAAGTGIVFGGALGYVGFVDPHQVNSLYPLCPFKWLTGWNCPYCGGLRMTHDLLHGDVVAAVYDNVFVLIGLPLLAGWVVFRRRHDKSVVPVPVLTATVVATIVWTVLRNLPGFPLVPTILSG